MNDRRPATISALTYGGISTVAAATFLAGTVFTGDYTWAARIGGTGWVFLLSMIILMPTVTPWVKRKLERPREDHQLAREAPAMSTHHSTAESTSTAKDPVCGMDVETSGAKWFSDYQGARYYFCAKGCKSTFDAKPADFVK